MIQEKKTIIKKKKKTLCETLISRVHNKIDNRVL